MRVRGGLIELSLRAMRKALSDSVKLVWMGLLLLSTHGPSEPLTKNKDCTLTHAAQRALKLTSDIRMLRLLRQRFLTRSQLRLTR